MNRLFDSICCLGGTYNCEAAELGYLQILKNLIPEYGRRSYLQSRNRDTDTENKYIDTKEMEGWVEGIGKLGLTHKHY